MCFVTQVEPFYFEGAAHSNEAQKSFQQRVALEKMVAADAAEFKARPMPNMSKKYEISASEKELTTVIRIANAYWKAQVAIDTVRRIFTGEGSGTGHRNPR